MHRPRISHDCRARPRHVAVAGLCAQSLTAQLQAAHHTGRFGRDRGLDRPRRQENVRGCRAWALAKFSAPIRARRKVGSSGRIRPCKTGRSTSCSLPGSAPWLKETRRCQRSVRLQCALANPPANNKDLHRPLRTGDNLEHTFAWKESRLPERAGERSVAAVRADDTAASRLRGPRGCPPLSCLAIASPYPARGRRAGNADYSSIALP